MWAACRVAHQHDQAQAAQQRLGRQRLALTAAVGVQEAPAACASEDFTPNLDPCFVKGLPQLGQLARAHQRPLLQCPACWP